MHTARLLFPALRGRPGSGFAHEEPLIERALTLGVGGFVLFGGTARGVAALTSELRRRSRVPLLIGADLERGAGQQFEGATPLPPLAALGALDDPPVTRRAAAITAREAKVLGVNWIFAPVADVDLEPSNPIIGTRAFGTDAGHVARHVAAWVEGCRQEGVLACAKHFPGHGRTVEDSHTTLPRVPATRTELALDIEPFRAAIAAGVDSLMTAHVVFEAFDSRWPATLSSRIVAELLRDELGFDGLVVSDALNMRGVIDAAGDEAGAAVAAVNAGCDALLYPSDLDTVAEKLSTAFDRDLSRARVGEAIKRIQRAAIAAAPGSRGTTPSAADAVVAVGRECEWSAGVAGQTIVAVRGSLPEASSLDLLIVDDDVGGPHTPPPRSALPERLRERGLDVRDIDAPSRSGRPLLLAVFADVRAWKRQSGLSAAALLRIEEAAAGCPGATVLLFGHPRVAADLSVANIVAAWGGEPLMQLAMADWIAERARR
jgi:beta-glucosidase-like glycosyl hydrolase